LLEHRVSRESPRLYLKSGEGQTDDTGEYVVGERLYQVVGFKMIVPQAEARYSKIGAVFKQMTYQVHVRWVVGLFS